jgi:hypothetical protein
MQNEQSLPAMNTTSTVQQHIKKTTKKVIMNKSTWKIENEFFLTIYLDLTRLMCKI